MNMNRMRHIYLFAALLAVLLATGCAEDDRQADNSIPDGYGRLTITISTPEATHTRAVDTTTPWLQGTPEERAIHNYHLLVCDGNDIIDAISGGTMELGNHEADPKNYFPSTQTITTDIIPVGNYNFTIYCLANFTSDMLAATGLTTNNGQITNTTLPAGFETKVMQPIANGINAVPATGLPMTGKLTQSISITRGSITTITDPLIIWRMMAKLEFQFFNESNSKVRIKGIEVDPINQATAANGSGVYLISQDNLLSLNNLAPIFANGTTKEGVSAIWPLNETFSSTASVSIGGVFSATELSYGSKLTPTGTTTTEAGNKMQKFKTIGNVSSKDNDAVITFKVTLNEGMVFTPKNLSFKACRGGTNGGNFDVEAGGNTLATGERPARWNGHGGNHVAPFFTQYRYDISGTSVTTDNEYIIKIYLYDLNEKDYAFSDVIISGDVTNNTGAAIQEHITLPLGALTDVGTVTFTPSSALELAAGESYHETNNPTKKFFFYVNESDATYTTRDNQLSLRFKIQRQKSDQTWYDDEIRYGVTIPYINGQTGGDGFNVIRRNDWIHIPVHITDWQLRIEPLAFVPIAGYPATTVSSDGLTTTFSTGGMIALQPFVKKYTDNTWRDFSDPEVTFVSISWKNSDGTNVAGNGKIVKTAFAYDNVTHSIIGELNNNLTSGPHKTTLTVKVKLGPTGSQFEYSFTCNVILQK